MHVFGKHNHWPGFSLKETSSPFAPGSGSGFSKTTKAKSQHNSELLRKPIQFTLEHKENRPGCGGWERLKPIWQQGRLVFACVLCFEARAYKLFKQFTCDSQSSLCSGRKRRQHTKQENKTEAQAANNQQEQRLSETSDTLKTHTTWTTPLF